MPIDSGLVALAAQKNQKKDPMTQIMQGLQIASSIYGIKSAADQNQRLQEELDLKKAAAAERPKLESAKIEEQRNYEKGLLQQRQDFEARQKQLDRANAANIAATKANSGIGLTPGQKASDASFAKDYVDWNAAGGYAGVQKQLNQLENAAQVLESPEGSSYSGPTKGLASAIGIRSFTNPEAVKLRQDVEQAVQGTLKQTLGAQFTEKEGARIMKNAYDESLPPEMNAQKLRATIKELNSIAAAKDEASKYYEEHGTLKGFKPAGSRGGGGAPNVAESRKQEPTTVEIKAPDGKIRFVPKDQVNAALKAGGVLVKKNNVANVQGL